MIRTTHSHSRWSACLLLLLMLCLPAQAAVFVIEATGLGATEPQANQNALFALKQKIITQPLSLGSNRKPPDSLSRVLTELIDQNTGFQGISSSDGIATVAAGLTQMSVDNIYQLMSERIQTDIVGLSILERQTFFEEAQQLNQILLSLPKNLYNDLPDRLAWAGERAAYYNNSLQKGTVILPLDLPPDFTITVDKKTHNSSYFFVESGEHRFNLQAKNFYPIEGQFIINKSEIKRLSPPLILVPDQPLVTALDSQLSETNTDYIAWLLHAYGWEVKNKSPISLKVDLEATSVPKKNNIIEHHMKVSISLFSANSEPGQEEGKALISEQYTTSFLYSKNNLKAVPREQRLLILKAVLRYLSLLNYDTHQTIYRLNGS